MPNGQLLSEAILKLMEKGFVKEPTKISVSPENLHFKVSNKQQT